MRLLLLLIKSLSFYRDYFMYSVSHVMLAQLTQAAYGRSTRGVCGISARACAGRADGGMASVSNRDRKLFAQRPSRAPTTNDSSRRRQLIGGARVCRATPPQAVFRTRASPETEPVRFSDPAPSAGGWIVRGTCRKYC